MRIEEQHPNVMQNIEFNVVKLYRKNPKTVDYDVLGVYEKLLIFYNAEMKGREVKIKKMEGTEAELYQNIRTMCEWRLGRCNMPNELGLEIENIEPIDSATLVLCLKRLIKSVNKWHEHYGVRGYLDFIIQFVK